MLNLLGRFSDRSFSVERRPPVNITYRVIRSARKTISIRITPECQVEVRCPTGMRNDEIRRFVESKSDWIQAHLADVHSRPALPKLTQPQVRQLAQQALDYIPRRVDYFAPLIGVTYGGITIRNQRTRWGRCSSKGNLNFNCLLMLAPPEVIDYVVVHELCHRRELNHSDRFWTLVEQILPDYKQRQKWLKDNGGALIARLP